MKKIIAILIAVTILLSFAGCSNQTTISYSASWGRTNVLEKSSYSVTVLKSDDETDAPSLVGKGVYVSTISGGNDEGYTVTTKFNFVGYYEMLDGTKEEVKDNIETKVVFSNAGNTFKPKSSSRKYDGSTIVYENGKYSIAPLSYSSLITYGEKRISVSTISENGQGVNNLPTSFEIKNPKTTYFDNEEMVYALRGMINDTTISSGLYTSFSLISGMSQSAIPMSAQITKAQYTELDTTINGEAKKLEAYALFMSKTGNDVGASTTYFFAKGDLGEVNSATNTITVDRARCLRIMQNIAYSKDYLVYDLIEYSYGEADLPV